MAPDGPQQPTDNTAASQSARQLFEQLLTRIWDEELTPADAQTLGTLLSDYPEFRKEYLEAKHSKENLTELCRKLQPHSLISRGRAPLSSVPVAEQSTPNAPTRNHLTWMLGAAAMIAATLLVAGFLRDANWDRPVNPTGPMNVANSQAKPPAEVVATLTDAVNTDIVDLISGAQERGLSAGQVVELESGVTELRFVCGAKVLLAGPARMTIMGPEQVKLDIGRIHVQMDKGTEGFEVLTPDGKITDLGTAFGVSVSNSAESEVAVFDGEVELESRVKSMQPARLLAGEGASFGSKKVDVSLSYAGVLSGLNNVSLRRPDCSFIPSKDAYVRGYEAGKLYHHRNYGSETELLVKYEAAAMQSNRRAWIGFDLSSVKREDLIGARLRLTVLPNHLAEEYESAKNRDYSESDANWEFEVAGLWDEFYDDWQEDTITWANAPGNDPLKFSGQLSGSRAPVPLGRFTIHANGQLGEEVVLTSPQLLDFLREDLDGHVTLIVSRRTPCLYNSGQDIVVHGFASRENQDLRPPTLELWGDNQSPEEGEASPNEMVSDIAG